MPRLFGIDIAAEVHAAISSAGGVLDATLVKVATGARTALSLANGTNPTETGYACKGFMSTESRTTLGAFMEITPGDLTKEERQTVTILGGSLPSGIVPLGGDRVTIESVTYAITMVTRDPAGAAYVCQVRGA
jgi:hypothetical protein